eukprot:jgi/Astpho2/997/Aster-x0964
MALCREKAVRAALDTYWTCDGLPAPHGHPAGLEAKVGVAETQDAANHQPDHHSTQRQLPVASARLRSPAQQVALRSAVRRPQCVHDGRTWLQQLLLCTQVAPEDSLGTVKLPVSELQAAHALLTLRPDQHVGSALDGRHMQRKQIARLLAYLEEAGQKQLALRAFQFMLTQPHCFETRDAFIYAQLMKSFSRSRKDSSIALQLFQDMEARGLQPDLVAYNTAITAAGRTSSWELVQDLFDGLKDAGLRPDVWTFTSLIQASQACRRPWKQALDLFEQMQTAGVEPNVVTYTTVMGVLHRSGQWQMAMRIFRKMEGAGIQADVKAYNAAIAACAKGCDWQQAWSVFAGMRLLGVQPSTVSFNSLLSACERCNEPDRALEVFHTMQRSVVSTSGYVNPSPITYNTLISALGKAGRLHEALEMYGSMHSAGLPGDVFTLAALITACEKVADWELAMQMTKRFEERGVAPNTVACNALINALGSGGQWQKAVEIFDGMHDCQLPVSGDPADAVCVPADDVTYASTISACQRNGQWQAALRVYEQLTAAGRQPTSYIYAMLLVACEEGQQWARATEIFKAMDAQGLGLDAVSMAGRRLVYALPGLLPAVPPPLLEAARAVIRTGRAARKLIDR